MNTNLLMFANILAGTFGATMLLFSLAFTLEERLYGWELVVAGLIALGGLSTMYVSVSVVGMVVP